MSCYFVSHPAGIYQAHCMALYVIPEQTNFLFTREEAEAKRSWVTCLSWSREAVYVSPALTVAFSCLTAEAWWIICVKAEEPWSSSSPFWEIILSYKARPNAVLMDILWILMVKVKKCVIFFFKIYNVIEWPFLPPKFEIKILCCFSVSALSVTRAILFVCCNPWKYSPYAIIHGLSSKLPSWCQTPPRTCLYSVTPAVLAIIQSLGVCLVS